MNRNQAKIYSKLKPEEVREVSPNFNPNCFDIMCAWGHGADVRLGHTQEFMEDIVFNAPPAYYTRMDETHIINGCRVPVPYYNKPELGTRYYIADSDGTTQFNVWEDDVVDNKYFRIGNCFRTFEDAESNNKARWKLN